MVNLLLEAKRLNEEQQRLFRENMKSQSPKDYREFQEEIKNQTRKEWLHLFLPQNASS